MLSVEIPADLTPIAEAAPALGLNREQIVRRICSGALRGARVAGRWFVVMPAGGAARGDPPVSRVSHADPPVIQVRTR